MSKIEFLEGIKGKSFKVIRRKVKDEVYFVNEFDILELPLSDEVFESRFKFEGDCRDVLSDLAEDTFLLEQCDVVKSEVETEIVECDYIET